MKPSASTYTHTVLRTSRVAAAICCALLAGTMRLAYAQEDDAAACAALKPREAAVAACTRRIESGQLQDADLALAYLNRARAHLPYPPRAELDKIGEDLDKAISLDPNNPEAYWTRASVFGWKQHEQGIADYAKVIALQPDRLDAYFEQAILLEYSDLDRAIANYSKVLELRPGWRAADVYRRRGRAYEMKGEDQPALADLDELIRMQPDGEPYSMRGFIHLRLRDFDRAITDFNRALALRAFHPTPMRGLALTYEARGDLDRALKQTDQNISLARSRGDVVGYEYVDRARIYFKMGRSAEALDDVDAVLRAGHILDKTQYPRVRLLKGKIYEAMGRKDDAVAELRAIEAELATSKTASERETLDDAVAALKRLGATP
jgi:tetratricopeptide (TPR) repeat protein